MLPLSPGIYIRREMLINGFSNAIFNGVIAWLLLKDTVWKPLWGGSGIAVDMAATSALLLFIVALIIIPLNRSKARKGAVSEFQWNSAYPLHQVWQRMPSALLLRALIFAVLGLTIVTPLSLLPWLLLGIEGMTGSGYALYKGVWAGLVAGIVCAPMIQLGLSDAVRS